MLIIKETQNFVLNYLFMIFDTIKKFIFPSRCVICDAVLPFGDKLENEHLCDKCKTKLEFIKEPTCKKCGAMISNSEDEYCMRCKEKFYKSFEYGFGLLRYNDSIKQSLHKIKYGGRKEYLYFYGKLIARAFYNKFLEINPDCFIPVPIHKSRLKERNFNQSIVLANVISNELSKKGLIIPVNTNIVFREKNTKVLNILDNDERKLELKNAFFINDINGIDKAIIIDDIYTTGSTINEISKCLKNAGINSIYFAVISVLDNL